MIWQAINTCLPHSTSLNILGAMNSPDRLLSARKLGFIGILVAIALLSLAGYFYVNAQGKSDFPDGYDAVQAAPNSHRVIFENEFVRVLEVTVPPPGTTEPMHHHRWHSFFLNWDTGTGSPQVRYHRADGTIRDNPSVQEPAHPGTWSVQWMKPEPMHAIEVVEEPKNALTIPSGPPLVRIEIKCRP
jgi:hypothetical protein